MIKGANPKRCKQGDVVDHYGKWPGSGAPANGVYQPTTRPDGGIEMKGMTLTRTGAGLYTVTLVDGGVGAICEARGSVKSVAARYFVNVLTETKATGVFTIEILVLTAGAWVLTDPVAADVIHFLVSATPDASP